MMGGDIRVESEKGHGSKFIFTVSYLPIKPECQYLFERKKDELLFDELPFEGLTALMAEPLSMKHKYYEKLLAPAGFAVKRVENIQQWFDYANKGNPVNAVILDTSVFDTATKDDFKKLREICKKQPLVIFGQEQNVNNFLRFCRNPNHAAFTEPVSCHDLVEALKKLAW
jgi:hypothetical protein